MRERWSSLIAGMALAFGFVGAPSHPALAEAPYVNSAITKERFATITAQDMDLLRTKKLFLGSRSFGLNLCKGFRHLEKEDPKFKFMDGYERFDVSKEGGDVGIIPRDFFNSARFAHALLTPWPLEKRLEEGREAVSGKVRLGEQADLIAIMCETSDPSIADAYVELIVGFQKEFPRSRVIMIAAGFQDASRVEVNEKSHAYSEKIRAAVRGKYPLYDLGAILSDDFRCGHGYCPEFSKDPAGVHPNLPAGETMMAKGFLLVLLDALRWTPPGEKEETR